MMIRLRISSAVGRLTLDAAAREGRVERLTLGAEPQA